MSRTHFIFGLIIVALLIAAGIGTRLVNLLEGGMILLIVAFASPFIYKFMQRTRKHDER